MNLALHPLQLRQSNNDKGFKERNTWNDNHKLQVPGNHTKKGQRKISFAGRRNNHVCRGKRPIIPHKKYRRLICNHIDFPIENFFIYLIFLLAIPYS